MTSLLRVRAFAANTFREAVRDKLLYSLLLFAAAMIASSVVVARLHMGQDERIYRDMGLSVIALFGAGIAVFVGINLVYREISLKTVYSMLAKPVRRYEFLLGKYLGLCLLLLLEVAVMSAFLLAVLLARGSEIPPAVYVAIAMIFLELALLTAVALFFSSFTTPYLAGMWSVALWVIGHLLADVRAFGMQPGNELLRPLTEAIFWALPNLDRLDFKAAASEGSPVELWRAGLAALYAFLYSSALLVASVLIFERRDFR